MRQAWRDQRDRSAIGGGADVERGRGAVFGIDRLFPHDDGSLAGEAGEEMLGALEDEFPPQVRKAQDHRRMFGRAQGLSSRTDRYAIASAHRLLHGKISTST